MLCDQTSMPNNLLIYIIFKIQCYMKQLLTGLHYCHVNQVLHRDIKGDSSCVII